MAAKTQSRSVATKKADEALLADLGYKQEFKREFTPLEVCSIFPSKKSTPTNITWQVFGIAFSIIGLMPSISSVLFYAIPNGGGPAMVWGVRACFWVEYSPMKLPRADRAPLLQWLVASIFIFCVGLSLAELASAAPTSGGVRLINHSLFIRLIR
jgi:hypothetical protein